MPKYRDKITGQVADFDHEPSEQELTQHFGAPPAPAPTASNTPAPPPHSLTETLATNVGAPTAGFMAGGAVGGKPGAVLGATMGTGLGDIYNNIKDYGQNPFGPVSSDTSQLGPNAPPSMYDEVKRLLGAAAGAGAGAYVLPAVTAKLPGPISLKNIGLGALGGGMMGHELGYGKAGAIIGGAAGGYNALSGLLRGAGNLSEALTTPRIGPLAATEAPGFNPAEAASLTKQGYSPELQAKIAARGTSPGAKPNAPQSQEPGLFDRAMGGLKDAANSVGDFASNLFSGPEAPPPAPKSPLVRTKTPGDIAERLGVTGQPVSSLPDMSRNPEMSWSADVSAAPQRTPQLSQTSPTDPQMPWEEHVSRSNPKRTATGGQNWSTPAYDPEVATPPGTVMHGQDTGPLSGLKGAQPGATPVGTHDEGLQRWIESGGTPESYLRAKGAGAPPVDPNFSQFGTGADGSEFGRKGPAPFGPNTVGAAEAPKFLPQTVDEAKGLSLAEQEAWASYKAANPGVTDGTLNSWYTSHQLGGNPNEGLDVNAMADKLTELLRARKP